MIFFLFLKIFKNILFLNDFLTIQFNIFFFLNSTIVQLIWEKINRETLQRRKHSKKRTRKIKNKKQWRPIIDCCRRTAWPRDPARYERTRTTTKMADDKNPQKIDNTSCHLWKANKEKGHAGQCRQTIIICNKKDGRWGWVVIDAAFITSHNMKWIC